MRQEAPPPACARARANRRRAAAVRRRRRTVRWSGGGWRRTRCRRQARPAGGRKAASCLVPFLGALLLPLRRREREEPLAGMVQSRKDRLERNTLERRDFLAAVALDLEERE